MAATACRRPHVAGPTAEPMARTRRHVEPTGLCWDRKCSHRLSVGVRRVQGQVGRPTQSVAAQGGSYQPPVSYDAES